MYISCIRPPLILKDLFKGGPESGSDGESLNPDLPLIAGT